VINNRIRNRDAILADIRIKYCSKCRTCWEFVEKYKGQKIRELVTYQDFPSWGKEKSLCERCEKIAKKEEQDYEELQTSNQRAGNRITFY
tara:strand:+ start:97 stop:366 length:270 start_codon:yes stop_codon:yes gene_type:complete